MADAKKMLEFQQSIVTGVMDSALHTRDGEPMPPWERAVVDVERNTKPESGDSLNMLSFAVVKADAGTFSDIDFRLDVETKHSLRELSDLMIDRGERWGTCHIVVESNGRFRFSYDYKAPTRMNGRQIHDEEYKDFFRNYPVHYAEERRRREAGEDIESILNPIFHRKA